MLQTIGLNKTSVTNSAFLTTLYVVLVPLFESIFFKRLLPLTVYSCAVIALFGTALMCGLDNILANTWNIGDLWTVGCAVVFVAQVLWLSHVAPKIDSPFMFNFFQTIWAFFVALVIGLMVETFHSVKGATGAAWLGILGMGLSSAIAFFLQIRAQKKLSASVASIMFLLESPFAAVLGLLILSEPISSNQWAGSSIILASSALVAWRTAR